jgi:PAS domain S-box-containing protein
MLDISSHKRMERALRDSRAFTRSVLDSLESEIVVLDDDGRIVQINQAWRAARRVAERSGAGYHLGETYEQVMRRYCTHQCKGLQRLLKGIETVRQGARHAFQLEYPCRGGHRPRWLLARVTRLKHMGRTWCIVWHQDITDTKETELALRDSERRYRDLVADMPSVVFRCANDRAWTMEFVSEAIVAVTGYPAEDFLYNRRRTYESIIHPDDRARVWDVVHQAVEHHQPYAVEYRIRTAEDTTRWVHEKGRGVYDDEQHLLRLEGVIFDVTDQKQAEHQLKLAKEDAEAASRLKSQFLANMSHEIRTPMNGVVGMVELLCQTSLNQRQTRYVQAIQNSAEMLLTVINDILDYSKIEAGRLDLSSEPFDLRGAIEEIAQLTGSHARRKQVEVIVRMAIDLPGWIRGDGTRFRQVLLNLVGNAVKFTEDGTVVIDASRQDDRTGRPWLRLAVTDTGIGIPPDQIKAIFEKFTQGDPSTTRKFGGTGLGLAISHRLVEMMGGKIDVESQLGRGSCFRFSIPVDPVDPPASQPQPPASIEMLAGLRVLVVDDNEINRRMLTETLEAWGLKTLAARSGPEALEAVADSRPDAPAVDLVILDVCMPGMDGFELADQLREVPGLRQRSVLMFSSCEHGDEPQRCHNVGAGSYLVKPVRQSQLAKVLLQMIGQDAPSPSPSASGPSQPTRSLRLLLAEDNPVNQEVAVELLQAMGHQVDVAGDGGQAVEMARAKDYHVILMDVQMPVMGGFEATEAIRRDQAGARHVPIIALTAHAMKGDDLRCRQAGMDGYVPKPIRGQAIAQAIAAVLDETDPAPADSPPPADPTEKAESITAPLLAQADLPPALPPPPDDEPGNPPDAQKASPATGTEPIDHRQLLHRCMDKPAIVHKVLARFLQTAEATVDELADALDTKDWQRLTRVAHGLKGAAASIAAEELRAAAAELEQRAKAEVPEHAQTSLLRVQAALPAVRDDAHRVVQDNAPSLLP